MFLTNILTYSPSKRDFLPEGDIWMWWDRIHRIIKALVFATCSLHTWWHTTDRSVQMDLWCRCLHYHRKTENTVLQTAVLDFVLSWKSFTTPNNDPLFTLKNTTVKRENWEVYWSQAQVPLGHTILLSGIKFCSQHWIGQWETSMLDQRACYQGNIASYHGQFSEKKDRVC